MRFCAFVLVISFILIVPIAVLADDGATQITFAGGWQPTWSPDGSEIAFAGGLGHLWTVPVAGGAPVQITFEAEHGLSPDSDAKLRWTTSGMERSEPTPRR
jgi:Tol biopolymer transport system component